MYHVGVASKVKKMSLEEMLRILNRLERLVNLGACASGDKPADCAAYAEFKKLQSSVRSMVRRGYSVAPPGGAIPNIFG